MSKHTIIMRKDDLNGEELTPEDSDTTFSLNGVHYQIDLSYENRENLFSLLEPYIDVARKVKPTPDKTRTPARLKPKPDKLRLQAIREWAAQNNYGVSARGRIPIEVIKAYEATQSA